MPPVLIPRGRFRARKPRSGFRGTPRIPTDIPRPARNSDRSRWAEYHRNPPGVGALALGCLGAEISSESSRKSDFKGPPFYKKSDRFAGLHG